MKSAVALLLGLCVAALVWAQNTTLSRTVTDGQVREQVITHKGQDPARDSDGDGIPDVIESQLGTDPTKTDTDADGFPDGIEIAYGLDPKRSDTGVEIVYVATKLPLPPNYAGAEITDISNSGFLGGYAYSYSNSHEDTAVRWNLNTGSVEIASSSLYSYGQSINDAGTVVGDIDPDPNFNRAMRWIHGAAPTRIGSTGAFTYFAWDVNDAGDVVGEDFKSGAFKLSGSNGIISSLLAPGGYRRPVAYAVNDTGQVLGRAENSNTGVRVGIIWNGTSPTLMLAGPNEAGSPVTFNQPSDISNAGHALGMTDIWTGKPGVWTKDTGLKMLPLDTGNPRTFAWKINDFGEVIGDMGGMPTLWRPNSNESSGWEIVDLSLDILDAEIAYTFYAYSINDKGQIAGSYLDLDDFELYPVVLTPVVRSRLLVDANRDGKISTDGSDVTSAAQPFRFWINDDDDSGDTEGKDVPLSAGGSITRNCDDFRVNGNRDLIDWFPVFLDIKTLLQSFPPESIVGSGSGVRYKLRHSEGAVKVVFTALTRAEALKFQTQDMGAKFSEGNPVQLASPLQEAWTYHITSSGFDIFAKVPDFYGTVINNNGGVILVEGIIESSAPLILTVEKPDGTLLAESKLDLKIVPMENMFHYLNLRHLAPGGSIPEAKRGPQWGTSTVSAAPDDPFAGTANRKNVVFVHGYNWNGDQARGVNSEMFKRLYWAGSKARYYAVLWRGDDSQLNPPMPNVTPDYHVNVGHALQTAPSVRGFLNTLAPTPTVVMAHSLGNMLVSFALTHERDPDNLTRVRPASRPAHVVNYFALNAAVPLEAFDSSDRTTQSLDFMPHPDWVGYDERLRATDWHELFLNTSDHRRDLTWQNLFAGLDIGVNFYSAGEEVLANPVDNSVPAISTEGLRGWISQEKYKGRTSILPEIAFRSNHGGWEFDRRDPPTGWYLEIRNEETSDSFTRLRLPNEARNVAEPNGVPTSALPERPFFRQFQETEDHMAGYYPGYDGTRLTASIGDAGADEESRKFVTRAKLLAEAIPALSYAAGSNPSRKFPSLSSRSQDMNNEITNDGIVYRSGWPAERDNRNWRHGDFREVAYLFTHPLYNRFVALGGLKP